MRLRLLGWADLIGHRLADPYCEVKVLGHHLPGWDWVQVGLHRICCAYEDEFERSAANE